MDKKFMWMYFDLAGDQIASDIWRKRAIVVMHYRV